MRLFAVLVVIRVNAHVDRSSVDDDVNIIEAQVVSQWKEVSSVSDRQLCDRVNEILRPLGYETSLIVVKLAKSTALYFISKTRSAVVRLRDQWESGQLKGIVASLFTFLSGATRPVLLEKLAWPLDDYKRSLEFFLEVPGKNTILP